MQEWYPQSYSNYAVTNPYEKIALFILKTGNAPNLSYTEMLEYNAAIKRINKYRFKNDIAVIPEYVLQIKKEPILKPVYAPGGVGSTTEYGPKMAGHIEGS